MSDTSDDRSSIVMVARTSQRTFGRVVEHFDLDGMSGMAT